MNIFEIARYEKLLLEGNVSYSELQSIQNLILEEEAKLDQYFSNIKEYFRSILNSKSLSIKRYKFMTLGIYFFSLLLLSF